MATADDKDFLATLIPQAVEWRRALHANPELAFAEHDTSDFVSTQLAHAGLEVCRGIGGTGVIGTLRRGKGSRVIGIRADMDALPVTERSGVAHSSTRDGVMHGCGHDGHTAIALAAAIASTHLTNLDGTVHFIFQPAEEGEKGAQRMIDEGLFERFPCDEIYALHNWPALPVGTCVAHAGPMMGATAIFEIAVRGKGAHAALPHDGADPIVASAALIQSLQTVVSRNVDPFEAAALSVTQVHAGEAWNAIPETCVIRGTTRWLSKEVGILLREKIELIASTIGKAYACEVDVGYEERFPVTENHAGPTDFVRKVVQAGEVGLSLVDAAPNLGSEDFAFMLERVPGCYLWLGSKRPGENPGLHSPRYDFNDDVIAYGVNLWLEVVRSSLSPSGV